MLVSASAVALVLGSTIGTGAGASGTAEVQEQLDAARGELAAAQETFDAQEEATAAAESARTDAEGGRAAAEAASAALQAKVDSLTADATVAASTIAARDTRISELESAAASVPSPVAVAVAEPADPPAAAPATSAYYANCDAVRAAGAAPIYSSDPGYSRKLDRDGDGVACE
jgi:colicin import membrane protein